MNDIIRAERARTGNYGYDYDKTNGEEVRRCPCCNAENPMFVSEDSNGKIVGCSECLTQKSVYGYTDDEWERGVKNV